jgi:hypothetical protein
MYKDRAKSISCTLALQIQCINNKTFQAFQQSSAAIALAAAIDSELTFSSHPAGNS